MPEPRGAREVIAQVIAPDDYADAILAALSREGYTVGPEWPDYEKVAAALGAIGTIETTEQATEFYRTLLASNTPKAGEEG